MSYPLVNLNPSNFGWFLLYSLQFIPACSVSLVLWDWLDEENRIGSISNSLNTSVLLKASITQSRVTCVLGVSAWLMVMWSGCDHITPVSKFLGSLCDVALLLGHNFHGFPFSVPEERKKIGEKCCKWSDNGFTQQKLLCKKFVGRLWGGRSQALHRMCG